MFFKKIGTAREKISPQPLLTEKLSARAAALEKFIVEEIEIGDVRSPMAAIPARRARPSIRWIGVKAAAACIGLWLLLFTASLFARSVWPVDETRGLAVAWEMWTRGEIVLPYLNGDLYARQPPLLPWLINAGWALFGVNDWWPRLLPALFGLAGLFVTGRLARLLWRENPEIARYAPLVLVGTPLWAIYTTLALPDMLLVFFTLLAWWAMLIMWRHRDMRAFLLLGAALGFGALSLGLVIYLYVLPLALLAPFWIRGMPRTVWKYWYVDIAKAVGWGLVILCTWIVPASIQAGLPYALKWLAGSLIAARLDLFPLTQPWWWYLPWLPIVCLPWSIWPLLWMRLWHMRRAPLSAGMAFCVIGTLSSLAALSCVEVKQAQFLLPLLPVIALAVSHLLLDASLVDVDQDKLFSGMTIPVVVLGGLLAVLPRLPRLEFLPGLLWELSPFVGIGVMGAGIALAWIPGRAIRRRVMDTVVAGVLLAVLVLLGAGARFNEPYRTDAVGQLLANARSQNRPIAHVGEYQGEFQFSGRLLEPLPAIAPAQAEDWLTLHPEGLLVADARAWQPRNSDTMRPAFATPYRGQTLRVWSAAGVKAAQNP